MTNVEESTAIDPRGSSSWMPRATGTLLTIVLVLFAALSVFPVVLAVVAGDARAPWIAAFAGLELVTVASFTEWAHRHALRLSTPAETLRGDHFVWIAALAFPLAGLIALSAEAGYAALALYFVVLWLLPARIGAATTLALAILVVAGQSVHHGMNFGAVTGPLVSAIVAIGIMLSTRALTLAYLENSRLVRDLRAAQSRLAASERDAGRLAERSRLGQELHDTVAQHLSSIQLLLGAAERADGETARMHVERARTAAGHALAQTRAFIHDLTPPQLEATTLPAALARLAAEIGSSPGDSPAPACTFTLDGAHRQAPMQVETALLRVAQEAGANARRHGQASTIAIRLRYEPAQLVLDIDDDGIGFDADAWASAGPRPDGTGYGLGGMRSRLAKLGGQLVVISEPDAGTLVRATAPIPAAAPPTTASPPTTAATDDAPSATRPHPTALEADR